MRYCDALRLSRQKRMECARVPLPYVVKLTHCQGTSLFGIQPVKSSSVASTIDDGGVNRCMVAIFLSHKKGNENKKSTLPLRQI